MYSKEQIGAAMELLKELVKYQTGLPEDKIVWTPDSMVSDLVTMLEGKFAAELAEMRSLKKYLF